MKKQNPQDERIITQRRKINSEAFVILWLVLFVSTIVQLYALDAPLEQYAVELICFVGISIYIAIRYIMLGLNIFGEEKRTKGILILNSFTAGVVVTVINGVLNYTQYAEKYQEDGIGYFIAMLGVTFISATAAAIIVVMCFYYLNKRRQEKIQKRLDEDEQQE